jgi:uncharacterized repeat protein (TIGR03803 family)
VDSVTAAGVFKTLYYFNGTCGCQSTAPLTRGDDGNRYGTTTQGGNQPNAGVIFKITPPGHFSRLHSFGGTHGEGSYAPLMLASDGNFYGTTYNGGMYNDGVVFKVSPTGSFTDLHDFDPNTEGSEGYSPYSGLIEGTNGVLYGTTSLGEPATRAPFILSPAAVVPWPRCTVLTPPMGGLALL